MGETCLHGLGCCQTCSCQGCACESVVVPIFTALAGSSSSAFIHSLHSGFILRMFFGMNNGMLRTNDENWLQWSGARFGLVERPLVRLLVS